MDKFYVRENTGAILNQKQYDNVPHHNPATDNYIYLGEFIDKSQARRHYYMTLPKEVKKDEG